MNKLTLLSLAGTIAISLAVPSNSHASTADYPLNDNQTSTPGEATDSLAISNGYELEELIVTTDKKVIQVNGTDITYNVKEDKSTRGESVLDALKKVPLVSVDGNDNIRIKGESNFKILINGKENTAVSSNASQVLKATPAEMLEKIEVITEPGAKYDAEGVGGILNLITNSTPSQDGYFGNATLSGSNKSVNAALMGRMRKGKLSADASASYSNGKFGTNSSTNENNIHYLDNPSVSRLYEKTYQENDYDYVDARVNLSYDLTPIDLITANVNFYRVSASLDNMFSQSFLYDRNDNIIQKYDTDISGGLQRIGVSAGASYQHRFANENQKFVVSYLFNNNGNNLNYASSLENMLNYHGYTYRGLSTIAHFNEHIIQADYSHPFGSHHTIDTGFKASLKRNNSDTYDKTGETADNNTLTSTLLTQRQDIYAGYLSYGGSFGKINLKAGIRYEHSCMGIDYHTEGYRSFLNHLDDVVPNAGITYIFSPSSSLQLSYQMRITRPSLDDMNPTRLQPTEYFIKEGNPDLDSEHNHRIALTYNNFGSVIGGNISVEYSTTSNAISSYTYLDGETVIYSPRNIGQTDKVNVTGFLMYNFSRRLSAQLNGQISYADFSGMDLRNSGFEGSIGGSIAYLLPGNVKMNVNGHWGSRNLNLQGYSSGWYNYGVSFSRSFLKEDALTLTANFVNFCQKYISLPRKSTTANMIETSTYRGDVWMAALSVSYNFGKKVQGAKSTDKNDSADSFSSAKGNSF